MVVVVKFMCQNRYEKKFDTKSEQCLLVGYSDESKLYRIYNPEKKQTVISRDIIFFENQHYENQLHVQLYSTEYYHIFSKFDSVGDKEEEQTDSIITNEDIIVNNNLVRSSEESDKDTYYPSSRLW